MASRSIPTRWTPSLSLWLQSQPHAYIPSPWQLPSSSTWPAPLATACRSIGTAFFSTGSTCWCGSAYGSSSWCHCTNAHFTGSRSHNLPSPVPTLYPLLSECYQSFARPFIVIQRTHLQSFRDLTRFQTENAQSCSFGFSASEERSHPNQKTTDHTCGGYS